MQYEFLEIPVIPEIKEFCGKTRMGTAGHLDPRSLCWRFMVGMTSAFDQWKWKSLNRVLLFLTQWTVVHGILQARILEWVAFPFSRGSSQPRDRTQVSPIAARFFPSWVTGKSRNTGVGSLSLLQRIFPTQESNKDLLHCRQFLYQLIKLVVKKLALTLTWYFPSIYFKHCNSLFS